MAKSVLTFNDGTNNYVLKFGTSTTSTQTGFGSILATYQSSTPLHGEDYTSHRFNNLPYNYDITEISGIANAAQFEITSVYFTDTIGQRQITDYTVSGTNLTINTVPDYRSTIEAAGFTHICVQVSYISGGYKIISEPEIEFSYTQIPDITLSTGNTIDIDLANYYTSNWKPKSYSLTIAGGGYSYTKNGSVITIRNNSATPGSRTTMIPYVYLYDKTYQIGAFICNGS